MMVHEKAGPEGLGVLRIAVFGIWVVLVVRTPLGRAGDLPTDLFDAPGVLALLPPGFWDRLFQPTPLLMLEVGLILIFLLAAVGARPFPLIGLTSIAGMLLFDGIAKGWGSYVNHAQMGVLYAGILIAVSPAADALSPFRRRERATQGAYRFPLVATAVVLAVTYALIGAQRLEVGGMEIFTGDALPTYLAIRTFEYSAYQFQLSTLLLESGSAMLALRAGFVITTVLEVLSPLALVSRRFRTLWLLVIVPFHLVTLVTMNIFFWENLILLILVFTDFPTRLGDVLRHRIQSGERREVALQP
jgi:hypothetical protein